MDEVALRQANQAYLEYRQAIERGAPMSEQIRLLEQWRSLYWQVTSRAYLALARKESGYK